LYHFEETLEHAHAVEKKYGIVVHWYRCTKVETREEFERVFKSTDMWISHPRRYEYLTKVEPLERALAELKVYLFLFFILFYLFIYFLIIYFVKKIFNITTIQIIIVINKLIYQNINLPNIKK
jgi:Phosphoadenosine phosphosulfate reductase family